MLPSATLGLEVPRGVPPPGDIALVQMICQTVARSRAGNLPRWRGA